MHEVPNPRLRGSASRENAEGSICVCFDMDGLLVNTEPMWWHSEAELMREYGGQWTDEDGSACVGGPLEKVAGLYVKTRISRPFSPTRISPLPNGAAPRT